MGRPRKTLKELEMSGDLAKNPGRYKDRLKPLVAPDPKAPKSGIYRAPRHLEAEEQKVWREIVNSAPPGLLGSCDMLIVELAVRLVVKMRKGEITKMSDATALANIFGKLGLTPGDRAKLNVSGPVEDTGGDKDAAWASLNL